MAARFVIPVDDLCQNMKPLGADLHGRYLLSVLRHINIDGKWFYAVRTNSNFSISMIPIKAVFSTSNHRVRVYCTKSAHDRVKRNEISGFLRYADEICAHLGYYAA